MKLSQVELFHVRMPLKNAFETSFGSKSELNHVIIKATDESGLIGYGESACPTRPDYCPETIETCLHILKDYIVPAALGKKFDKVEEFIGFYEWVRGNNFAKAGLEMAVWDLISQSEKKSLALLVGGTRSFIDSGVSLGIEKNTEILLEKIGRFLEEGYKRVKLKVKPGQDYQVIDAVRKQYPDLNLMMDANSAYTIQDIAHLKSFDQFNLMMIEQPLAYDDLVDHAKLQNAINTPICLDESIHSVRDAAHAVELGSCRMINIKAGRVGGLLEAIKIHNFCFKNDIAVWCGGMHEFGVGRAHNVALSSLPGFSVPGDVSGSDKYYTDDIVKPQILAHDGQIQVNFKQSGLGYEIDTRTLSRFTVSKIELSI